MAVAGVRCHVESPAWTRGGVGWGISMTVRPLLRGPADFSDWAGGAPLLSILSSLWGINRQFFRAKSQSTEMMRARKAQLMLLMHSRGMWRVTPIIDSSSICKKNPHTIEEYLWKSGRADDKFDCGCIFYLLISPVFLLRRYTVPYTVAVGKGAEYYSHENQDQPHHHQQRSYQPEQTNTFQTNTPDSSTQL